MPTTIAVLAQAASEGSTLVSWLVLLAALAILPFVLAMVTSFAKLVIVGGILRQALGTQQVPPNSVLTGLALILTVHIMWPTGVQSYNAWRRSSVSAAGRPAPLADRVSAAADPLIAFLDSRAASANKALFQSMRAGTQEIQVDDPAERLVVTKITDAVTIQTPAFVLTELTQAFQIGFLLFVPFVVIDLLVSNVLMAMGMHMLTPSTLALPLKLLLFILVDGWRLVIYGLVAGYAATGGAPPAG